MDGVKGCLSDRELSIPEAKECVKDRRERRRIVGGDVDDPGWSRLHETVKAVDVFDLLCSGIGLIWRKKCCVSRAYAVCWVTPNFWENALTAEKKWPPAQFKLQGCINNELLCIVWNNLCKGNYEFKFLPHCHSVYISCVQLLVDSWSISICSGGI